MGIRKEKVQSKSGIKENNYRLLFKQVEEIINNDEPIITNLSNITAAINQTLSNISWVGFYIAKDQQLYLGPYQGKTACTRINFGDGVCGLSAKLRKTQVVENVHDFPGHIACDSESNSEIVVPILHNDQIFGVLDLDSHSFSNFNNVDEEWLEKICELLAINLKFDKFILS